MKQKFKLLQSQWLNAALKRNVFPRTLLNSAFSASQETVKRFLDLSFRINAEMMENAEEAQLNAQVQGYALLGTLNAPTIHASEALISSVNVVSYKTVQRHFQMGLWLTT